MQRRDRVHSKDVQNACEPSPFASPIRSDDAI